MLELLLTLLLQLTGINRTVDPGLTAIAEVRVQEIQTDFSHAGQRCCWEILAWNYGRATQEASTLRAVEQWRASSVHWGILVDPSLTRIGCAVAFNGTEGRFVCILDRGTTGAPAPTLPAPPSEPAGSEPVISTLPDAALPTECVPIVKELLDWATPIILGLAAFGILFQLDVALAERRRKE